MQSSSNSFSGTRNRLKSKILFASEFRHWSEFDTWAEQCSHDVLEAVSSQGCAHGSSHSNGCQGSFRNWAKCRFGICRFTAEAKLQLQQQNNLSSEAKLRHTHYIVLQNLKNVAKKLSHHWRGDVKENKKVVGYDEIWPSLAVLQPGVPHPYFTVRLVYPNRLDLLPEAGSESNNLVSAYNEIARKKPTNTRMAFAQNCIAQAIQDAMFTGTGYGCLFNNNQAVFLKVAPDCTERRNYQEMRHRVHISREFKCDSEGISIFHGITSIMLKGQEHEQRRTFLHLQKYYRMLKKSKYTRDRKELRYDRESTGA